jgi:hypothetical protein
MCALTDRPPTISGIRAPLRAIALIPWVLLALAVTTHSQSSRAAARFPPCRPGHAGDITADEQAQVFVSPGEAGTAHAYACTYAASRTYDLGLNSEAIEERSSESNLAPEHYATYRLAGNILAYEYYHPWPNGANYTGARFLVIVRDLRTGRIIHRVPSGHAPPHSGYVGSGETIDILVKHDGAVAWIARDLARETKSRDAFDEIYKLDRTGLHVLAAGQHIATSSFSLIGSTLFWTERGHTRTATLQ